MLRVFIATLTLIAFAPSLHAADFAGFKNTIKIMAEASSFYWDEHYDSEKLLEETGAIYGTGVIFNGIGRNRKGPENDSSRFTYGGKLKFQFGTVDYDGQTQAGDPVKTEVDYFGLSIEGHVGRLIKTKVPWWFVEPQFSLGVSSWSRDLESTSDATGYTEDWENFYTRWGVASIFLFNTNYRMRLSGGINIPVWVKNRVDLGGSETLELSPKAFNPTPFLDLTFEYKKVGVSFFYDSFLYGESDVEELDGYRFLQPESYTYKAGIRLTFTVY